MSDKFKEYIRKKALLEQMQAEVSAMQADEEFNQAVSYAEELEALNKKYNLSLGQAIELLEAMITPFNEQIKTTRKSRGGASQKGIPKSAGPLRRWTNPHTGTVVEGRRASHGTLRDWIKRYGQEEVDKWVEYLEDNDGDKS